MKISGKYFISLILGVALLTTVSIYAQNLDQSTPQAAYKSYLKAMASGNFDVFTTTIVKAFMDNPPSPEEQKMFGMVAMMTPKNVQVLNESVNSDNATLTVKAFIPMCSNDANGTVNLKKEDGVWKVHSESYKEASCSYKFGL